jgi:glutathione S-transferase
MRTPCCTWLNGSRPVFSFHNPGPHVLVQSPSIAALPLLYSYRRCPYAMRVRMALLQAQRGFEVFEIDLRNKPAAMLVLSPKATVPVLLLSDGRVLEESWDMMRWAWEADDSAGWWQRAQSAHNLDLLHRNDGDFKRQLDRYKYPQRFAAEGRSGDAARAEAVAALLVPLEARLRLVPYLGGDTPCAADLAIFPFVRQFAAVDPGWFAGLALAAVQAWLAGWTGSGLFGVCMAKVRQRHSLRLAR